MHSAPRLLTMTTVLALALVASGPAVRGTLIEVGMWRTNDALLTRDTETGLDWLNVSVTAGYSTESVLLYCGPGQQFESFRHSTSDEILTLFTNADIPHLNDTSSTVNTQEQQAPVVELIGMLGVTQITLGGDQTWCNGVNSVAPGGSVVLGAQLIEQHPSDAHPLLQYRGVAMLYSGPPWGSGGLVDYDTGHENVGHWLVRDSPPVPEPSGLVLAMLAVMCVSATRRSRRDGRQAE